MRLAHAELEERVRDRTTELQAANQDARSILLLGFARLAGSPARDRRLLADSAGRVCPEHSARGAGILARRAAQHPENGQLVDDLLAFSRLGRQPVKLQQVSVDKLVAQCVQELAVTNEQPVEVTLGHLPDCQADPAMLKQVWINLLSNAMKYSARRESPRIEVGCRAGDQPGRWTYFVKDNGVGFDMRYADKLFGVFSAAAPRRGVRRHGRRAGHRPAHHPPPRRPRLGRGRSGPGRDVLLHDLRRHHERSYRLRSCWSRTIRTTWSWRLHALLNAQPGQPDCRWRATGPRRWSSSSPPALRRAGAPDQGSAS